VKLICHGLSEHHTNTNPGLQGEVVSWDGVLFFGNQKKIRCSRMLFYVFLDSMICSKLANISGS
jgi:hypothetical protein